MSALTINIITLFALLLLSAFFSGGEMAFLASNKLLIEINRARHPRISRILDIFMAKPSQLITTVLVGNNIVVVVYGLVVSSTLGVFLSVHIDSASLNLFIQTVLSTIVMIVMGEFMPKTIIQINPSAMLNVLAMPLFFFYIIFYPICYVMHKLSVFIIRYVLRVPYKAKDEMLLPGRVDFDNLVSMQAESGRQAVSDVGFEARLMRNALDFSSIRVRDCFVPRTDIVALNADEPIETLRELFVKTGFSKIIIYEGSIDSIVGYVHVSEMFIGASDIRSVMSPIAFVPETMRANMLLKQFTSQNKCIAIVVDELGGTSGLITLEDVLEEIFGEIDDEHDQQELTEKCLDDHTYLFAGRLEVEYINEKYGLHLPLTDDYDTVAGLILSATHSIPKQDDMIEVDNYEFRIVRAGSATIDEVQLLVR